MMGSLLTHLGADLRQITGTLRELQRLQRPGAGIDFSAAPYRDRVRRVVERIHPRRMRLELVEIVHETPETETLRFRRTDGPLPPFRAGQYVSLVVRIDGVVTSRAYSISSAPGDEMLDLTVCPKPGGFVSRFLAQRVGVGDVFEASGPKGHFCYEPLIDRGGLLLVAGGSGITPFRSIVRDAARHGWPQPVHLVHGARTAAAAIFAAELRELAAEHPAFDYTLVLSEPGEGYGGPTGLVTRDILAAAVGEDLASRSCMLCGPNAMLDLVRGELEALGVPPHRIRRELYGPPQPVHEQPGWPADVAPDALFRVEVKGHPAIRLPAGEPLLNGLERHGLRPPAVCRAGGCGVCRMRLLSGPVFMPARTALRQCDRTDGYIHACVAYPIGDVALAL